MNTPNHERSPSQQALESLWIPCARLREAFNRGSRAAVQQDDAAAQTAASDTWDAIASILNAMDSIEAGAISDSLGASITLILAQANRARVHRSN